MPRGLDGLRTRLNALRENTLLRRGVSIGLMVFTIGLLAVLLIRGRSELNQIDDWSACLKALGQGFLLYPISLGIQALTWSLMIARLARVKGGWRDVEIYAYTHLMRRLPGGIWYLAGRMVVYSELGILRGATLAASGLEWLLLLLAAALVWGVTRLWMVTTWWLSLVILAVLLGVGMWSLNWAVSTENRSKLPRFAQEWLATHAASSAVPSARELTRWMLSYLLAYVIGGAILFLLIEGVAPGANIGMFHAVNIWALTGGVASLTSMILPAGLGIRELTLTALLAPEVATARGVMIALLLRALFIAGDLVWGGALWAAARALKQP